MQRNKNALEAGHKAYAENIHDLKKFMMKRGISNGLEQTKFNIGYLYANCQAIENEIKSLKSKTKARRALQSLSFKWSRPNPVKDKTVNLAAQLRYASTLHSNYFFKSKSSQAAKENSFQPFSFILS